MNETDDNILAMRDNFDEQFETICENYDIGEEEQEEVLSELEQELYDYEHYKDSIVSFARYFLSHHVYDEFGEIQLQVLEDLETLAQGDFKRMVLSMPRGFGKSTLVTLIFVLYAVLCWGKKSVAIVESSADEATEKLIRIKHEIETNEKIMEEFGELRGKQTWSNIKLELTTGQFITSRGVTGSLRGIIRKNVRPDLIILDDVEKDSEVESPNQRKKLRNLVTKTIMPMLDPRRGTLLSIGTVLHYDGLIQNLLDNKIGKFEVRKKYAAEDMNGQSTWPDRFPKCVLEEMKSSMGAAAYAQEMMNDPISDDTTLFRKQWLDQCKSNLYHFENGPVDGCETYQSWDLAAVTDKAHAIKTDSDYTVGYTVGVFPDGSRRVFRIYRNRGLTHEQLKEAIVREYQLMRPDKVIIENVAFQNIFVSDLIGSTDMPIVKHGTTGSNKMNDRTGPGNMAHLFENKKYVLPYGDELCRELVDCMVDEFYGYGAIKHDDMVMALWFIEAYVRGNNDRFDFIYSGENGNDVIFGKKNDTNKNILLDNGERISYNEWQREADRRIIKKMMPTDADDGGLLFFG